MKEESILNTQFAIFFNNPYLNPENLWVAINTSFGGVFSTPLIQPVPTTPEFNEFPVVQIKSTNININIARLRLDVFIKGAEGKKFKDVKKDLLDSVKKIIRLIEKEGISYYRMGFVSNFFIEEAEPQNKIANFLAENPTNINSGLTQDISIRYSTREKIRDFDINNLTIIGRFKGLIEGLGERDGIIITRDFNTLPNKKYELKEADVLLFINESEKIFTLEKIVEVLCR